jgi:hypothetical protein
MASDRPGGDDEPETNDTAGDADPTEAVPAPAPGGGWPRPPGTFGLPEEVAAAGSAATTGAAGAAGEGAGHRTDPDATQARPGPLPDSGDDLTEPLHESGPGTTAETAPPTSATVFGAPPVVDPAAAVDQVEQDRLQESLEREARIHRRRRRALITALVVAILVLSAVAVWLVTAGGDDDDGDDTPGTTTSVTTETTAPSDDGDDGGVPGGTGPVGTAVTSSTTTPSTSSTSIPTTSSTTVPSTSSTVAPTSTAPPTTPPTTPTTEPPPPVTDPPAQEEP